MSNVQEALKAAIEALENEDDLKPIPFGIRCIRAINKCKAALAEIEKCEPDAEVTETAVYPDSDGMYEHRFLFPDRLAQQTELYLYNPNEPQPREECEPVGEVVMVHEPEWMKPREGFKWYQTEFPLGTKFYTSPQPIEKCEPVYLISSGADEIAVSKAKYDEWTSAKRISYTSPQPREWVGLSDDELNELFESCQFVDDSTRCFSDLVWQAFIQLNTKG